jgi:hypothetical protein
MSAAVFFFSLAWEGLWQNKSPLPSLINCTFMANDDITMDNTMIDIANDIWSTLADAATVEAPLSRMPFHDEVLRSEDKTDYKKPLELLLDKYKAVVPKTNLNFNVKYTLFSINMAAADKPIHLYRLLMYATYKLKVFGEDAFGKFTAHCKTSAQ